MKAISLWQPWATLMASGAKRVETRGWPPHALKKGDLVAIHAAKLWAPAQRQLLGDLTFRKHLEIAAKRGLWDFADPPLGCVVAIARFDRFEETHPFVDTLGEEERAFGNYRLGRFAWIFDAVRPLQPIPLRGLQRIFNWQVDAGDLHYLEERNEAPRQVAAEVAEVNSPTTQWQPSKPRLERCRHFNGTLNRTCKVGMNFADMWDRSVSPAQLPCLEDPGGIGCKTVCPKVSYYTREERVAMDRETAEALRQFVENLDNAICPTCKKAYAKQTQVGRCVYAEPCGHRLYQGKVDPTKGTAAVAAGGKKG
jgi:activating signal cointegrator 1